MHLDEVGPGRLLDVAAQTEAASSGRSLGLQPDEAAGRRVEPVGCDEVAGLLAVHLEVVAVVAHAADRAGLDADARTGDLLGERRMQDRATYAPPGPGGEAGLGSGRATVTVQVADPRDVVAVRIDPEGGELGDGTGHQALAAGLVDRAGAGLAHDDVEPGRAGVQRRRHADRPAAGHHQVTHR